MKGAQFPFLECREESDGHDGYQHMAYALDRNIDWSLQDIVKQRCFLGHMFDWEMWDQQRALRPDTYFVCFIDEVICFLQVCYKNIHGRIHCWLCSKWASVCDSLVNYKGTVPLDRGDALIFVKCAKRKAREAIACWLVIGLRLKVCKDVRVLIAKKLWDGKREWVQ